MCSLISVDDRGAPIIGVNYDFYFGHGLLVSGRRGVDKYAMSDDPERLRWRTVYGSVTLNQFGCELPTAGINEAGLAVHLLECEDVEYPQPPPDLPQLIELQWLQYVLDTCASVDEATATLERIGLARSFFGLHFALADPLGVAFVTPTADGHEVTRSAPGPAALSNTPLSVALADARGEPVDGNRESLRRFRTLRAHADAHRADLDAVEYAFAGLELVARRPGALVRIVSALLGRPRGVTVWQTVFVPAERRLELSTLGDRRRKTLSLSSLDLDATAPVMLWDLEARAEGDLAPHMRPYARAANAALITRVYRHFTAHVPVEDQRQIAAFPDDFYTPHHDGAEAPAIRRAS